ncbi:hypothetical protein ACFW35_13750 [Fictibacillus sp. NPDC058756]|uniref:hypothetical protein n=1 Tax=Fictibacillus sp. NPDC058756 TaxID=3346625 RepID=UPI0036C69E49
MKKMIMASLLFLLTACSSENGNATVEQLKEDHPHVKEVAEELPESVQENLAAPKKLPFKPKNVELIYAGDPPGDPKGEIHHTEFLYGKGDGTLLQVTMFHNKKSTFHNEGKPKTTKLKDGTKVTIDVDTPKAKEIRWKRNERYYALMMMGSEITIDDLLETANSMEYYE